MIQSKNVRGVGKERKEKYKLILLKIIYTLIVLVVVFVLSFTLHT